MATKIQGKLASQYGGNSRIGWVSYLPASWVPYIQLARLSPPAGLFLVYFPHLFGVLHGAIICQASFNRTTNAVIVTFAGSFFVSNAIHIWNDLVDAPLDAMVQRTRFRPIPRGAVSPRAALYFTASQAIGSLVLLAFIGSREGNIKALMYALPSVLAWTYYPWAKRHTNYSQVVLGFCLAWGIVMGSLAEGVDTFAFGPSSGPQPAIDYSATCLFFASILWTVIYDTIYAHQDLKDDLKAGIKSLAVLYQDRTKPLLWCLLSIMASLLVVCGMLRGMGVAYYTLTVGGSSMALGLMILKVELRSSESCWWWFRNGFWFAGGAIVVGLLAECARRSRIRGVA